jgi:hypothetical protein
MTFEHWLAVAAVVVVVLIVIIAYACLCGKEPR